MTLSSFSYAVHLTLGDPLCAASFPFISNIDKPLTAAPCLRIAHVATRSISVYTTHTQSGLLPLIQQDVGTNKEGQKRRTTLKESLDTSCISSISISPPHFPSCLLSLVDFKQGWCLWNHTLLHTVVSTRHWFDFSSGHTSSFSFAWLHGQAWPSPVLAW